jgi:hypothetical protein
MTGCGDDKYNHWGSYYSTERKIVDGDKSERVSEDNRSSFMKLVSIGEIIELSWTEEQDKGVQELLGKSRIRELRYGAAIIGGAWPVNTSGGSSGYFYKHDAITITKYIERKRP